MEQPPIPTKSQRELDFTAEPPLEELKTTELEARFKEAVGFSADNRFYGMPEKELRALLIEGIKDPNKGKDAVAAWDREYDRIGDAHSGK